GGEGDASKRDVGWEAVSNRPGSVVRQVTDVCRILAELRREAHLHARLMETCGILPAGGDGIVHIHRRLDLRAYHDGNVAPRQLVSQAICLVSADYDSLHLREAVQHEEHCPDVTLGARP